MKSKQCLNVSLLFTCYDKLSCQQQINKDCVRTDSRSGAPPFIQSYTGEALSSLTGDQAATLDNHPNLSHLLETLSAGHRIPAPHSCCPGIWYLKTNTDPSEKLPEKLCSQWGVQGGAQSSRLTSVGPRAWRKVYRVFVQRAHLAATQSPTREPLTAPTGAVSWWNRRDLGSPWDGGTWPPGQVGSRSTSRVLSVISV